MELMNEPVVITIRKEDQKQTLNSLTISIDAIEHDKTMKWSDFKNMASGIAFDPDDMLVQLGTADHERLMDKGNVELYKALRIGWFHPNYHKTKFNLFLNESIRSKLMNENPELCFDSFLKFRRAAVDAQTLDIIAGGLGLVQILHSEGLDDIFARMSLTGEKLVLQDVRKSDRLFISQLFWFWNILSDNDEGSEFESGITGELYQILFDHLLEGPYDRNKLFEKLKKDAASKKSLHGKIQELDDLYHSYVIKGLTIQDPTDLQKTLIQFSRLAKEDIDQLPEILETNGHDLTKTAVYMLGMAVRYQRLNAFIDQGYCLYEMVRFLLRYLQTVRLDEGVLTAELRADLDDYDRELVSRVKVFLDKRSDIVAFKKGADTDSSQAGTIKALQAKVEELQKRIDRLGDDAYKEISMKEEQINGHLVTIKDLRETISDRDEKIQSLQNELVRVNNRLNESINELGDLEGSAKKAPRKTVDSADLGGDGPKKGKKTSSSRTKPKASETLNKTGTEGRPKKTSGKTKKKKPDTLDRDFIEEIEGGEF